MVETRPRPALTFVLFAIYALALIGLVLFKFPFSYDDSGSGRHLNLIPLMGSFTAAGVFRYGEIVENVVVFVPLGVYLSMVKGNWSVGKKILAIVATTVAFEAIQYIFAIGRADITDVLSNTLGGLVGIGSYAVLSRVLGSRTNRLLTLAALVLTAVGVLFLAYLLAHTLRHP